MSRILSAQLDTLRTLAHAAQQANMDVGLSPNIVLALLSEVELLRQVLADARSSYDVTYHPAEEGNLYQSIAVYDRSFTGTPEEPAHEP